MCVCLFHSDPVSRIKMKNMHTWSCLLKKFFFYISLEITVVGLYISGQLTSSFWLPFVCPPLYVFFITGTCALLSVMSRAGAVNFWINENLMEHCWLLFAFFVFYHNLLLSSTEMTLMVVQ